MDRKQARMNSKLEPAPACNRQVRVQLGIGFAQGGQEKYKFHRSMAGQSFTNEGL